MGRKYVARKIAAHTREKRNRARSNGVPDKTFNLLMAALRHNEEMTARQMFVIRDAKTERGLHVLLALAEEARGDWRTLDDFLWDYGKHRAEGASPRQAFNMIYEKHHYS